jgi:ammonium transporter Rh
MVSGDVSSLANRRFAKVGMAMQVIFIILFATCTDYGSSVKAGVAGSGPNSFMATYPAFQHVHVMMFIGFGFLMTFLHKYGFGATGFNFLIGAFVIQWSLLSNGFWANVSSGSWDVIGLDVTRCIMSEFTAAVVMITFGGVLGKTNPLQLITIAFIEVMAFGLNEYIGLHKLHAVDCGASMYVHTFGAYFGLACAWVLSRHNKHVADHPKNDSTRTSDTFAMIGTLFLWMFWPSFNGGIATGTVNSQHRVFINTYLSLAASCLTTFYASAWLREDNKFSMVDIQNATLAGGVAVGASADMVLHPWGALLIGSIAGVLSVVGYVYVSPYLEEKIGLYDTCGIHNLHGMPGLMGGLAGTIAAAFATKEDYGTDLGLIFGQMAETAVGGAITAGEQATFQLAATIITLVLAIVFGCLTGALVKCEWFCPPQNLFDDAEYWECGGDEESADALIPGVVSAADVEIEMASKPSAVNAQA